MQKVQNTVLDQHGNPFEGATVEVLDYPGGGVSSIFSDDSSTPTDNPVVTDERGHYAFYVANGHYSLFITAGDDSWTINDVIAYDPGGL